MVRFTHPRHGVLTGYGALDKKKSRVTLAHNGRPVSARTPQAQLLSRNYGYGLLTKLNSA